MRLVERQVNVTVEGAPHTEASLLFSTFQTSVNSQNVILTFSTRHLTSHLFLHNLHYMQKMLKSVVFGEITRCFLAKIKED